MTEQIPGGCFSIARTIFQSAIWGKPPQYTRLFIVLLSKAAYLGGPTLKGHTLKRGELITTYGQLAGAISYTFNRALITPSIKEIRIMLSWLQSDGIITVKPLIDGTSANKGRPTDLTRAYIGLLIYIVNYDTYQDLASYKGRDKGRPSSELGQLYKEGNKENNTLYEFDFSHFYETYPKHEGRKKALDAWAKIKASGGMLDTILKAIEKQKAYKTALKIGGAFVPEWPLPATWLNGHRWEDEVPEVTKSSW